MFAPKPISSEELTSWLTRADGSVLLDCELLRSWSGRPDRAWTVCQESGPAAVLLILTETAAF